jgi:hypothetical protein
MYLIAVYINIVTPNSKSGFLSASLLIKSFLKGIVQRDVRGVESRLKRSVLINCLVAIVPYLNLKGNSCERGKNRFQSLNNY